MDFLVEFIIKLFELFIFNFCYFLGIIITLIYHINFLMYIHTGFVWFLESLNVIVIAVRLSFGYLTRELEAVVFFLFVIFTESYSDWQVCAFVNALGLVSFLGVLQGI